ncbi:MAG TPA: cytochrome c oxidase assembly protein [Mycobacteriales bacterium]|nr:cytochrome c oxidase assembly protein [Mycobacteriales bacterium]
MTALPPLTLGQFLRTWSFDPWSTGFVVLAAAAYLWGMRAVAKRGRPWPMRRLAGFVVIGLVPIVLATMSGLAVYDRVLLWPMAVQVMLLLTIAPVGLGLGDPIALVTAALPPSAATRWRAAMRNPVARVLTFPVVAPVLAVATQFVVFFTGYIGSALHHPVVMHLLHLQLLVTGCLFALPILGVEMLPAWCTQPVRLMVAAVDGLLDAIPGITVMTSNTLVAAGYYGTISRGWGPTRRWDQIIAGGLLLTLAEVVAMPFIAILYGAWVREDGERARLVDAALDQQEQRQRAAATESPPDRPWWEVDPGPLADRAGRYGWRDDPPG